MHEHVTIVFNTHASCVIGEAAVGKSSVVLRFVSPLHPQVERF